MVYFLAPFAGWLVSGCLKFLINFLRFGSEARNRMGYGGFPSTHTSTVATTAFLIGLGEGWLSPVFGLAIAFLFIVIIDATNLRLAVGQQAAIINRLMSSASQKEEPLRERMGHTRIEILGGLIVGFLTSIAMYYGFKLLGWF